MGTFLNPGNSGFTVARNSAYVDKSGLIGLVNASIGKDSMLTCVSRPRRFGKSTAAQMLCAYYDRSCDSDSLFDGLTIRDDPSYREHLNQYDVLYIDITSVKPASDGYRHIVQYLTERISSELLDTYPSIAWSGDLAATLSQAVEATGRKFIAIIDEWDSPIRENPQVEGEYLEFLRSLFKSSQITRKAFAAAYMTGILPIKKDGSQSAISDFREYTMLEPGTFAPYVGFTEKEVRTLCRDYGRDFETMKAWYDGYEFEGVGPVYNPNSVMRAAETGKFRSYWTRSSAASGLMRYIELDYEGLSKTVVDLVSGAQAEVPVSIEGFANDLATFRGRDDVLTLLIHLGYLAYDPARECARIPNEEIRSEFSRSVMLVDTGQTARKVLESKKLIEDTLRMDSDAVAAQLERVHEAETTPLFYNSEAALRAVVKLAYFAYSDLYLRVEELPGGSGFADIAFIPKPGAMVPAMIVELKWDDAPEGAIAQIKDRHYPAVLEGIGVPVLLVGISYNKDDPAGHRTHRCVIEAA